jgi:hypothetical protein
VTSRRNDPYQGQNRYNQPGDYSRRGIGATAPEKKLGAMTEGTIAAQATVNNAKKNCAAIESYYTKLQTESQMLQGRLSGISASMVQLQIQPPPSSTSSQVVAQAPTEAPKEEDVATGMGAWVKKNWVFVLLGAGAALYVLNRFTKN